MLNKINGIDVGNHSLKVAPSLQIKSTVGKEEGLLGSKYSISYNDETYYIGEGEYETELNKSQKENFIPLMVAGILLTSGKDEIGHKVVCGLPVNQYKANKDALRNKILSQQFKNVELNVNGKRQKRDLVITDCKVYPEGIGAYYSLKTEEDYILVDIGGRTTEVILIANNKIELHSTVNVGTLNIYTDIANSINSQYGTELNIPSAERVVERGFLKVDGKDIDMQFATDILKNNFLKIKAELDMRFPVKTEKMALLGGGALLFEIPFKNRYNCELVPNPIFANAIGFKKVGEETWG